MIQHDSMSGEQRGFALLVSMLVLMILTIFVVNAVRNSTLQEKMSGAYMDRNRAMQNAEQAMRQAEAILAKHAADCLDGSTGCTITGSVANPTVGAASGGGATELPSSWSDVGAVTGALTSAQESPQSASFVVTWLAPSLVPTDKTDCKAYSIMGRGTGMQAETTVILQTVAYVCAT